ncbi:MAG: transposase [Akkermansiaceae bacterium]|nr:transposase [Akkermansiaceae bacterium]MCP5549857.1 transposase [Akkermansiaceae bacterium]
MRKARLIRESGDAFYHCMSRVVDKRFIFNAKEKNFFRKWMRKLEAFSGVEVVTFCLMSNHFHLLIRVPERERLAKLTVEALLDMLPILYNDTQMLHIRQEIDRARASGDDRWLRQILDRYESRRGDLSVFLKELKQRFTQWYNRTNNRRGTLWEDRFKSVLVEGSEEALLTMAAYIDLNPVRAGMVSDPKDYRWCGYAEAVAGRRVARRGLAIILEQTSYGVNRRITWANTATKYRLLLFGHGEEREGDPEYGVKSRKGFSQERVEAEVERGGKLSIPEILRCRVRYFCDGAVFGSVEFVNDVFESHRTRYGPKRKSGARKMRGAEWGNLRVLRDLRSEVFG